MRSSHVTDTHRQCRTCKAWKVHAEYDYQAATCKECRRARHRERYRQMTTAELDQRDAACRRSARARRARTHAERRRDVRFAAKAMQARGWTWKDMQERSGVQPETVQAIMRGETKFVRPATVRKLYAALRMHDA